jgi:hypothetical protein
MSESLNPDWDAIARAVTGAPAQSLRVFADAGLSPSTLQPLCQMPFLHDPYGRKVLYRSSSYEVMLATWALGAECAPHDHGFSNGVVWLAQGRFAEIRFALDGDLLPLGNPLKREPGVFLHVADGDIHSMRSLDAGLSLHIYSPPIRAMKVFDRLTRSTLTVSDDCGAWVPQDPTQILDRQAWPRQQSNATY